MVSNTTDKSKRTRAVGSPRATERWTIYASKWSIFQEVCYQCKDSYVHHWIASVHRENDKTGQGSHETLSMASQDSLEIPNASEFSLPLTQKMKQHGEWWLDPQNILCGEFLHHRDRDVLIFTDASNAGWGPHLDHVSTGGLWSHVEKQLHTNMLELKAVILALKHFSKQCGRKQVLVASDNTTVVAHINKRGGPIRPSFVPSCGNSLHGAANATYFSERDTSQDHSMSLWTASPGGSKYNIQSGLYPLRSSNRSHNSGNTHK